MSTLGWIGSIFLATCGVPELVISYRSKRCSLSWGFLLLWFFGEIFVLVPVLSQKLGAFLVFNYSLNTCIIAVLIYYKLRREQSSAAL